MQRRWRQACLPRVTRCSTSAMPCRCPRLVSAVVSLVVICAGCDATGAPTLSSRDRVTRAPVVRGRPGSDRPEATARRSSPGQGAGRQRSSGGNARRKRSNVAEVQAVDLVDPGFIVVAGFRRRHSSVWVTSASARHFRRIGPQIPGDVAIDRRALAVLLGARACSRRSVDHGLDRLPHPRDRMAHPP